MPQKKKAEKGASHAPERPGTHRLRGALRPKSIICTKEGEFSVNLEAWAYMLKRIGSKRTKTEIKDIIKRECLLSPKKVNGAYVIDNEKVWNRLVMGDANCVKGIEAENIQSYFGLEAWFEEIQYRQMWRSYRGTYKKGKR